MHNYMQHLLTLLLAYSIAGIQPVLGAPATPEVRGAETWRITSCPLDIVMRYHYRAMNRLTCLPAKTALGWIQKRDEADRAVWVDRYRNTQKGLEVILETIIAKEPMWEFAVRQASAVAVKHRVAYRRPAVPTRARRQPWKR